MLRKVSKAFSRAIHCDWALLPPTVALQSNSARRKGYEVSAMKAIMEMIGLAGGPVRPPLVDLRKDEVELLRDLVQRWKPWV
jgi:dihydrodipicolinate synthase/N-acetylneuraminate lyase